MQLLAPSQIQIMLKNIEITTEIGNRIFIGIFVIDSQSTTYINMFYLNIALRQIVL